MRHLFAYAFHFNGSDVEGTGVGVYVYTVRGKSHGRSQAVCNRPSVRNGTSRSRPMAAYTLRRAGGSGGDDGRRDIVSCLQQYEN